LGNQHGIAAALINLGNVACDQGDLAAAAAHFEEGLAHGRELGDRLLVAGSLNNLGNVACTQGDYPKARAMHEEGLALRRELGARQGIADSLDGFARIAHGEADFARAALLWGALERLREEIGAPVLPNKRPLYESEITAARAALNDDTAFNLAWREGRSMTQERAIEYALGSAAG
jgi:tetratricopeptide (TPR) repeat protein